MTDKKRIKILKEAKMRIKKGDADFICHAINNILERSYRYSIIQDTPIVIKEVNRVLKVFPEFEKHKPKKMDVYSGGGWWDCGYKKPRIKAINSMITEIKAKSND